jgi:hypothetical protein
VLQVLILLTLCVINSMIFINGVLESITIFIVATLLKSMSHFVVKHQKMSHSLYDEYNSLHFALFPRNASVYKSPVVAMIFTKLSLIHTQFFNKLFPMLYNKTKYRYV